MKKILLLLLVCVLHGCGIEFVRNCKNTETGKIEGRADDGPCEK